MIATVYTADTKNKNKPIRGTGRVTGTYKTKHSLLRYGAKPLKRNGETIVVEIFYSWENRYKQPDDVVIL